MKLSLIIAPLIAAKVSHEVIMETVLAFEAQQTDALEKRREADRNRQAKKRTQDKPVTLSHVTRSPSRSHARVEDSSSNLEISGQEETKEAAPKALSDLEAFRADLLQDVDAERVDAIVKHRRSKKGQLTAYAAKLFRRDAAAVGMSLQQVIDTCISRGWLTVKPEYLAGRSRAPPSTQPSTGQDFNAILDNLQGKQSHDAHSGPSIDGSVNRADRGGAANPVQLYAFPSWR